MVRSGKFWRECLETLGEFHDLLPSDSSAFTVVSHWGSSPYSGHYKTFVLRGSEWFVCDDSNVKSANFDNEILVSPRDSICFDFNLSVYRTQMHMPCSIIKLVWTMITTQLVISLSIKMLQAIWYNKKCCLPSLMIPMTIQSPPILSEIVNDNVEQAIAFLAAIQGPSTYASRKCQNYKGRFWHIEDQTNPPSQLDLWHIDLYTQVFWELEVHEDYKHRLDSTKGKQTGCTPRDYQRRVMLVSRATVPAHLSESSLANRPPQTSQN